MKNTRLTVTLAAFTSSAGLAFAQDVAVPLPTPANVMIESPLAAHVDVQVAAANDQLRQAARTLESSQRAMQYAQAKAGDATKSYTKRMVGLRRSGSEGRALVIPKETADPKVLAEEEEDMNVMAHILDKAISEDGKSARAMGIPVFGRFLGGGDSPQNLHLEGYGVLFFLNVHYPLQAAPDKESEPKGKEKNNSEWEQARREMTQPATAGGADAFAALGETFEREFLWGGNPPMPYEAERVEQLKSSLISALKNAAHIRRLKADEMVTVVVTGTSPDGGGEGKTIKNTGYGGGGSGRYGGSSIDPATGLPVAQEEEIIIAESSSGKNGAAGKMVLRVRKSDAEAFQNGKLSLDEFRKKVAVLIY